MCSAIATTNGISASMASSMACAALIAGTWIRVASGLTARAAYKLFVRNLQLANLADTWHTSDTVLNTGRSRCLIPPLPGVTPPTTFVPWAIASCAFAVAYKLIFFCQTSFIYKIEVLTALPVKP